MDEEKISLPSWLPWATTACLAALVACLGELWIIEKEKSKLTDDELALVQTAFKASQNELEAERIVSRREIDELKAAKLEDQPAVEAADESAEAKRAALELQAPNGDLHSTTKPTHVPVIFPPSQGPNGPVWTWSRVRISFRIDRRKFGVDIDDLPAEAPDRDYQVWLDGASPLPVGSAPFHAEKAEASHKFPFDLVAASPTRFRYVLVEGKKGGAKTIDEALATGSIVLAREVLLPSISGR